MWNSLEVMKLLVSFATPVAVVLLGVFFNRRLRRIEDLQWSNRKLADKRMQLYEVLAPDLNTLMCYCTFIGPWKDFAPPEIIQLKRNLDRVAYVNAPLLTANFLSSYEEMIRACFALFVGWGSDAQLRTSSDKRRNARERAGQPWEPEWNALFVPRPGDVCPPEKIKSAFESVIRELTTGLGIGAAGDQITSGGLPSDA